MSNRYFACKNSEEADKALEYIHCIAEEYGWVTVADVHDILGTPSTYADNNIGWTHDALADARIDSRVSFLREDRKYIITMPEYNWFTKNEPKEDKKTKCCTDDSCEGCDMYDICNSPDEDEDDEDYTSEPFSVIIPLDKYLECPDIVADIAENVTNRPVSITIC